MKLDKNKLDLARAKQFLSLQQVARYSGVSDVTIRKGYNKDIDPLSIAKIARALNVDIEEILAGDEHA